MTARVTLSCDGVIPGGNYPCRQAAPVGTPADGAEARRVAAKVHGWSTRVHTGGVLVASTVQDLCPACTRRAQQGPRR